MRFDFEKLPVMQAEDILRHIQRYTSVFNKDNGNQRIFLALNEAEAAAISVSDLPYVTLVHHRTDHVYNDIPSERLTRVNEDWDAIVFVGRDGVERRDGAREATAASLNATHEVECAIRQWFPNNRYRPTQIVETEFLSYLSSDRVARRVRFTMSYILSDTELCPQPELICITKATANLQDSRDTDKSVLPSPVPAAITREREAGR